LNYYGSGNLCVGCDPSCNGCVNSATNCLLCDSLYSRVIGSNACTQTCGNGFYSNLTTQLCTVCPIGCSLCSSSLICTQCQSIAGMSYYLSGTTCTINCPIHYFGDYTGGLYVCTACDSPCSTCSGSSTTCLSCIGSYYLIYGTQSCQLNSCPDGQFYASSSNVC